MYQSPDLVKVDLDIKDNFAAYGENCHWYQVYDNVDICQGNSQNLIVDASTGYSIYGSFSRDNCYNGNILT